MKVLHINCNFIGSRLHRSLIQHLRTLGGEHFVFAPSDGRALWRDFVPETGEVVAECYRPRDKYLYFFKQWKIRRSVETHYDLTGFDCLHAYTLFTDGNCAMTLSRKYGIPYVVAVRNTDVNGFFKRRPLLRKRGVRILRGASRVFFLSEGYRRKTIDCYVPPKYRREMEEKSQIVPNGIDDFWVENIAPPVPEDKLRSIREGRRNLLLVGRVNRWKNPETAVRAARILRGKNLNVHFTLVGYTEDEKMLARLREEENFTYLSPMPKEQLIDVYRANDFFVLPSHDETFGLVYPEAMSQGLPVLYSKNEGFDGNFAAGEVGWPVEFDSAEDIAERIEQLAENYEAVSGRCRANTTHFRWQDIARKYTDAYGFITGFGEKTV